MSEPKRMGRPPKAPEKGKRRNYAFRMGDVTAARVASAASANGRSSSEEIEARVEASFTAADLRTIIREEIRAAMGEQVASKLTGDWAASIARSNWGFAKINPSSANTAQAKAAVNRRGDA